MDYPDQKPRKKKPTFNDLVLWAERLNRWGTRSWIECVQERERTALRCRFLSLGEGIARDLALKAANPNCS
jgi:hypothetical protein